LRCGKPVRSRDPRDAFPLRLRSASGRPVKRVPSQTISRPEHGRQKVVEQQSIKGFSFFVADPSQKVLNHRLHVGFVFFMDHEIAILIKAMGNSSLAETFHQLGLHIRRPTRHLKGKVFTFGIQLGVLHFLDLINQGVDRSLQRFVDQQGRSLPRMNDGIGPQQLGQHRSRFDCPIIEVVGQPFTAVVINETLCVVGRLILMRFSPLNWRRNRWGLAERTGKRRHNPIVARHVGVNHLQRSATVPPMADLASSPDRNLALELVRATEAGAIAAARWMGRGDKEGADGAAVDAMRAMLSSVSMDGKVVIGEGEKDEAPMLFNGERIGNGSDAATDIAVDPIDGTTLTALGRGNALSVIAVSPRGTMFDPGPCFYMEKIAVGPEAKGAVSFDRSITENLHAVAEAKNESVRDLTVVILDRPRHDGHIAEVRAAGARIRLIPDGDVAGAISTAWPGTGADILIGIGGTPEGVITAAALKCMGGEQLGRLWPRNDAERAAAIAQNYDLNRVLTIDDLIMSDDCFFAATGITDGDLLPGVRFDSGGCTTDSLVMRSRSGTVRRINGRHRLEKVNEYSAIKY